MIINKNWCKIAFWFSYIFNTSFWHSIRFPRFNPSSVTKIFNVFLVGTNTKQFWSIPKEKYIAPFRITNLSIKSFVNPFVDIALTFCDSSLNSFLFDATSFSSSSKSPF